MPEVEVLAAMANAASSSCRSSSQQCVSEPSDPGSAWFGAAAQLLVGVHSIARAEPRRSLCSLKKTHRSSSLREDQVSQFVGPRCARNASLSWAVEPWPPRSQRQVVYAAAARPVCAVGQRVKVRPNHSLQPTVIGMALGPRSALVHHAPRGPSAMPLPAAELELQGLPPKSQTLIHP